MTPTPSTTYYYCWQAEINGDSVSSSLESFTTTAAGTRWETPTIDSKGYFSSWVLYNNENLTVSEVGIFVGTDASAVNNIQISAPIPNGIERKYDRTGIDTNYNKSKGGTYIFYRPPTFTKISFIPGVTYYYKFYSIDEEGDVVYSFPLSQYKWPGDSTQYALTIITESGGSIIQGNSGNYAANNIINLIAVPQPGYKFTGWSTTAGSFTDSTKSETSFTMPAQAVTITAHFEQMCYSLHVTSNYGGVDASVNGYYYHMGDTVTLTAYTVIGYRFVCWTSDNGGIFENSSNRKTKYTIPAGNVNLTAVYESGEESFLLSVEASEGGTVDTSVNGEYYHGDTVIITATPKTGWFFDHWQSNIDVIDNPLSSRAMVSIPFDNVDVLAIFINHDPAWTLSADEGTIIRRAQYKEQTTETTTSTNPVMEGWNLVNCTVGEWGNWSTWSTTAVTGNEDKEVETENVPAVYRTKYTYTRWRYYNTSYNTYYFTYHDRYGGEKQTKTTYTALSKAGTTKDGYQRYNSTSDPWYNESQSSELVTAAYTQYRFRTRSRVYTFSRTVSSDVWKDKYTDGAIVRLLYKKDAYKDVLRVPTLSTIAKETFAGSGATVVLLANGTKTIEEYAFADCPNLVSVMIPQSVVSIDKNAFSGCNLLTLFVYRESYGASFAESFGIPYQFMN